MIVFIGTIGILLIIIILNGTSFLYHENPRYTPPDESRLMSSETGSFTMQTKSDKVILFVHGFPSTPAVYRWPAEIVSHAGWDVSAPLLPGFGTTWEDLLDTNFSQWYAYLKDVYLELRKKYRVLAVVGTSMGGALTLKLAEEFSPSPTAAPDAIVTIAAPVFINSVVRYGILKNPLYYMVRTIGWFIKSFNPANVAEGSENNIDGRGRWRGYSGNYPRQTYSLKLGLKRINRDLCKITVPCLLIQDKKDRTVPSENIYHISRRVQSTFLEMKLTNIGAVNHEHHSLLIYDSTRQAVIDRILQFLNEHTAV